MATISMASTQIVAGLHGASGCEAAKCSSSSSFRGSSLPATISNRSVRKVYKLAVNASSKAGGDKVVSSNLVASVTQAAPPPPPPPSNPPPYALIAGGVVAAGAVLYTVLKPSPAAPPAAPAAVKEAEEDKEEYVPYNAPVASYTKQAAPAALKAIDHFFPGSIQDEAFVRACADKLEDFGFNQHNCIALVNTCRDEVCRPLATYIDKQFGLSFNVSGLGGLVNCGKTGFAAGMSHSPQFPCDKNGVPRERYVFFAFPHVSVGESGEVGSLLRRGRGQPSSACGALIAIKNTAKDGPNAALDPDDLEFGTLKKKVLMQARCRTCPPEDLTLVDVTVAALDVITEDLETLIEKVVNPANADYAVITGVQIHSGNQVPGQPFQIERTVDYVYPRKMYAIIRGERFDIQLNATPVSTDGTKTVVARVS